MRKKERCPQPLWGFFLVRRSVLHEECKHFRSLTDCDDPVQAAHLAHLAGKWLQAGDYVRERREVERWLRTEAIGQGVQVEHPNPLYFKLSLMPCYPHERGRIHLNLVLSGLRPEVLSFTIQDSFINYAELQGRPFPNAPEVADPRVFNAWDIRERIWDPSLDLMPLCKPSNTGYIEAQLWSRDMPDPFS